MNWSQRLQRHQNEYGLALLGVFLFLNTTVLATSVVMEAGRNDDQLPFRWWDPFVWEYSSGLSILLLVPVLHWFLGRPVFTWTTIRRSALLFCVGAVAFSIAHVSLMVGMRELAYFTQGRDYHFGSVLFEFLYELRKDVLTFIIILIIYQSYRFIVSRIIGEANLVAEEDDSPLLKLGDRLLVKKLGKEFVVKLKNVEWMESSGNYVNLHIKERIYPIRKTLSALTEEIADKGFCRIHRSHAINLDLVDFITPLPSGDGEVKLKSGKVLNISRRYKNELKQRLL